MNIFKAIYRPILTLGIESKEQSINSCDGVSQKEINESQ